MLGRASRRTIVALVMLAFAGGCTVAPAGASASVSAENAATTHAYLVAQYKLARVQLHEAAAVRRAETAAAAQIARECRGALSGMPQPSFDPFAAPTPRVRGENARLNHQEQTIGAELDRAISIPGESLYRPAEEAYAAEVRQLTWSNPAITSLLQTETAAKIEGVSTPAPPFCADAKAWAQSGYRALSAASRGFGTSLAARESSTPRDVPALGTLLEPYENASDRALIRKTGAVGIKLLAGAFAAFRTDLHARRIVGFPHTPNEEPKKDVVLGHGHTAAGTRFQMSSETSNGILGALGAQRSCHRAVAVFYTRPSAPEVLVEGGPNNPVCISPPHVRHPELFCEEGIETIQTAVPASVRSVRLVLADGRTIESHAVHITSRHEGPVGMYAQEVRGSSSHAVSLVELNAGGEVVLTLKLARYRCVKPKEPKLPLGGARLATGHTPEGEPFTISTFGSFDREPALSVDAGVEPDINTPEPAPLTPKAFPWSLSIGCAPHPFAILYAILTPPGESVTAQTPQGTVALNVVPIEPRVHAKGPLVYGVFSALPSELTVLGANGSIVYTESLQAQVGEVAQFCEGYEES